MEWKEKHKKIKKQVKAEAETSGKFCAFPGCEKSLSFIQFYLSEYCAEHSRQLKKKDNESTSLPM